MKKISYLFLTAIVMLLLIRPASALTTEPDSIKSDSIIPEKARKVSISFNTTINSRFIWRGLELGDHPHIQPSVTFSVNKFFVGVWASHSLGPVAFDNSIPGYKEVVPYIGYAITPTVTLLILDHYNPNFGNIVNFRENGDGNNTVEARAVLNLGNFDVLASVNIYNDPKKSTYLEVGYTATMNKGFKVRPLASITPTESPFNGTDGFSLTQLGAIISKDIALSKEIGLTLRSDFVINPNLEKFYAAFGVAVNL